MDRNTDKEPVKFLIAKRFRDLIGKLPRGAKSRLAKHIGIHKETVSKWASGDKPIPVEYLPIVARFLGTTVDYLLTHEEAHGTKGVALIPKIGLSVDPVPTPEKSLLALASEFVPVGTTEDGSNLYAIEVSQSSMAPKIEPSDLVVCHRTRPISGGDIVHFSIDGKNGIGRCFFSGDTDTVRICDETGMVVESPKDSIRMARCCTIVRRMGRVGIVAL